MQNVFFILGSKGAGKKEILFNLLDSDCFSEQNKTIFISKSDENSDLLSKLKSIPKTLISFWDLKDGCILNCEPNTDNELIFVVADGLMNPVDQLELWKDLFLQKNWQVARIITVVDCRLLKNPELESWLDACVHFSDAVLLNHRTNIENSEIKKFTDRYQNQHFPCLFDFVKKDKLDNWEKIFNNDARRMTDSFDFNADSDFDSSQFDEIESSFDLEEEDISKIDKYFERRGDGVRKITLPCIGRFLPKEH